MKKRSLFAGAASVCAAAVLVACGGSSEPVKVAASDAIVAASPATAAAATALLTGVTDGFTFPSGIPELGATGSTVLKVTGTGATPEFTLTSGADTASGTLSYGSCIFTIKRVNGEGSRLGLRVGQEIVIEDCNVRAVLESARTNTDLTSVTGQFRVGRTISNPNPVRGVFKIDNQTGEITYNGDRLGAVSLLAVSGT